MRINFDIPKSEIEKMSGDLEEKICNIIESSFSKTDDNTYKTWGLHDIKEEEDKYIAVLNVVTKEELQDALDSNSDGCSCCSDCSEETCENIEQNNESPLFGKSAAYEGPWSDKKFELDIAQALAFFETVQFCDYLIKLTKAITPVAARSVQECQRFILENFTEFNVTQLDGKTPENANKPLEIKIKDEFADHLKVWQAESLEIFEKIIKEEKKKPQIVQATMMPQSGFDPKGPGFNN